MASGQQTEIVPAIARPLLFGHRATDGARWAGAVRLIGAPPYNQCRTQPLPVSLGGLTVRIAGVPVPIFSVEDGGPFWFQVPWDLPDGYSDMVAEGP